MSREGNLKGAEREALVVAELSRLGFETFTGNGNTTCDIIAVKHGLCLRIEVKGTSGTGGKGFSGPFSGLPNCNGGNPDCRLCDILIRVGEQGEIYMQRSILHSINKASAELPLREEINSRTTKKNLRRAQQMEN